VRAPQLSRYGATVLKFYNMRTECAFETSRAGLSCRWRCRQRFAITRVHTEQVVGKDV